MFFQTFQSVLYVIVILSMLGNQGPFKSKSMEEKNVPISTQLAPDQVIIKFKSSSSKVIQSPFNIDRSILSDLEEIGISSLNSLYAVRNNNNNNKIPISNNNLIYKAKLRRSDNLSEVVKKLLNHPNIEYAEPDYYANSLLHPNDPRFTEQWGLEKIQIETAWDKSRGSNATLIAVLDSGIDLNHPDLGSNLWTNPGEIPDNGIDDDNNGYIDDVHGWNFVSSSNNIADDYGHGTLISGITSARTDNSIGIAGICGNCQLMVLKVSRSNGVANYSDLAAGVNYAVAKGAKVINISLGGYSYSQFLHDAIKNALDNGVLVIAGSGNDNKYDPFYPAAFEEVLSVGSTNSADKRLTSSNYGTWIDISAPGENILTTSFGGDYSQVSGTSVASPYVAGVAALIFDLHAEWSPKMVKNQILHTSDPIDILNPGYEGKIGKGRINADNALTPPSPLLKISSISINTSADNHPDPNTDVSIFITLLNDWADVENVSGILTTSDPGVSIINSNANFGKLFSGQTGINSVAYQIHVGPVGYSHIIPFELIITGNSGSYSTKLYFSLTTKSSEEPVQGTILADTVWTNDKIYKVNGNIGIPPNVTLTIQPGTNIMFAGNYSFNVGGTLIADGTSIEPIKFFPYSAGTKWNQLLLDNSSSDAQTDAVGNYLGGTILRYVQIDGSSGIKFNQATPYISHVNFTNIDNNWGVSGDLGDTPLWIIESKLFTYLSIYGTSTAPIHIINTTIKVGYEFAFNTSNAPAYIENSDFNNKVICGNACEIKRTTLSGLTVNGHGVLDSSVVTGNILLHHGEVSFNKINSGNLQVSGNGTILGNSLTYGGITAGDQSTITDNYIHSSIGTGITLNGHGEITKNRVINSKATGIEANSATIRQNLVANSTGDGIKMYEGVLESNTIIGTIGNTVVISGGILTKFEMNNFDHNKGTYDLQISTKSSVSPLIVAKNNWWGSTETTAIKTKILDYLDDYTLSEVDYSPFLSAPSLSAPAYLRSVTLDPSSPVGIQSVKIALNFSRSMDYAIQPKMDIISNNHHTWSAYTSNNIPFNNNSGELASSLVKDIEIDSQGNIWIVCPFGGINVLKRDGTWLTYNASNSGLATNEVISIEIDSLGNKWIGTEVGVSVLQADGSWKNYNPSNTGNPSLWRIYDIAQDKQNNMWFTSYWDGVSILQSNNTWVTYKTGNSGLPTNYVYAVEIDSKGTKWFSTTNYGLTSLKADGTWQIYNKSNSKLLSDDVTDLKINHEGDIFIATGAGVSVLKQNGEWVSHEQINNVGSIAFGKSGELIVGTWFNGIGIIYPDGSSKIFNIANSGLTSNRTSVVRVDNQNNIWVGTAEMSPGSGVFVYWEGIKYSVTNNPIWIDSYIYQANADISVNFPKGVYMILVSEGMGTDGILIAEDSDFSFVIDYAGSITDQSPPSAPFVLAWGDGGLSDLYATWVVNHSGSPVDLYRYAIGTQPGGTDVINWSDYTTTSIKRSSLVLQPGVSYYFSVKARNVNGLWSEPGTSFAIRNGNPYGYSNYLPFAGKYYK